MAFQGVVINPNSGEIAVGRTGMPAEICRFLLPLVTSLYVVNFRSLDVNLSLGPQGYIMATVKKGSPVADLFS